ncbi:MAG: DUF2330 domain-containing protein [bacterium]
MKIKTSVSIILFTLLFPALCFGNRGMIPVNPNIIIFEPTQRAMIAWDGTREILLLSTDLSASDSTLLLEVLPLPSEPEVKKGDLETFRKATDLINSKLRAAAMFSKRNGDGESHAKTPGGEVTFHEKIGAHDISVTHLLDADGFIDWVRDYLKTLDIEEDVISETMKGLIEEYVKDDFTWFVFDVVTLGTETVTNEPIQYAFKTDKLYYPLKITQTGEGYTSIELMILTPQLLRNFPGLPINKIHLPHDPITITNDELKDLNKDMFELLGKLEEMRLRIWEIEGELKSFDEDLIAY